MRGLMEESANQEETPSEDWYHEPKQALNTRDSNAHLKLIPLSHGIN